MEQIELSQGKFALVDDDAFDEINQYNWCFAQGYAVRNVKVLGKYKMQYMHRLVTSCPADMNVDHKNHDKLDNQKNNLRICSTSENLRNQQIRTVSKTSVYKGVTFHKQAGKWQARIQLENKNNYLGLFANEIDAAIAYNVAAIEMFGEFALLNDIK